MEYPLFGHERTANDMMKELHGSPGRAVWEEHVGIRPQRNVTASQERAWKHRKFTDAVVVCDGARIPVHRATLASASPVFDAAFTSTLIEGQLAVYEIQESSSATVEAMLSYIYTWQVTAAAENTASLLELAVQYELSDLYGFAAKRLLDDLTEDNVRERMLVLKRHRAKQSVHQALATHASEWRFLRC